MADIKRTTEGLEHCLARYVDGLCDDCPYMGEIDRSYIIPMKCKEIIMRDALELLKSQQAEIERMKGEGTLPTWKKGKAFCGNCGGCLENKEMFSSYHVQSIRFCKWCGAPVNWSNE